MARLAASAAARAASSVASTCLRSVMSSAMPSRLRTTPSSSGIGTFFTTKVRRPRCEVGSVISLTVTPRCASAARSVSASSSERRPPRKKSWSLRPNISSRRSPSISSPARLTRTKRNVSASFR